MLDTLQQAKELLGIEDTSKDKILEFIQRRIEKRLCKYCNLTKVPAALQDTIIDMVIETYHSTQYGKEVPDEIKSMTEGDVSWSFRTASQIALDKIKNPSFMNDYKSELKGYRKVGWPK